MKTQAQVIQKQIDIDSPINEDIGYLLDSINRSSNLVGQLLQLFRLQNTQVTIKEVELSKCLIDTIDDLEKSFKNKSFFLVLNNVKNIYIDSDKNLLSVMFKT